MGTQPPPESGGGEGGGAPVDPYAAAREAGFDENTDWSDLAAKVEYVEALTDPNRHFDTLENSLRQWGHLPEGSSLSDMFPEEEGPDEGPAWQPPQPQGQPQIIGYDGAGEPIYSAPPQAEPQYQQQQWDSSTMENFEQRLMSKVEQQLNQRTEDVSREMLAQRMADDVETQMEQVRSSHGLDENESAYLWNNVRARLAIADIQNISQVKGIVEAEWQQIENLANARAARLVDPTKRPPMTTDVTGPAPAREAQAPGTDAFRGMLGETARRLGIDGTEL